jgi:hypothetical protein
MRLAIAVFVAGAMTLALAGAVASQSYNAALEGAQEVPPVATPGYGDGVFTLDGANMLHYTINYFSLLGPETAAHIHGPANPGVNAGVVFPLPLGTPKIGVVGPLTAAQIGWLNSGLLYVNVHTTPYPGGEIRGQIYSTVPTEDTSWGAIKEIYEAQE